MLTINYPFETSQIVLWKDRLENIIINHRLNLQKELPEPLLIDGEHQVHGTASINAYLDTVEIFVEKWYEDRCDKYEMEKVEYK